jgi:hypothetical protein
MMTMRAYEGRCHVCGRDDFPDLLSTAEEITRLTKQNEMLVALIRCVETNLSKGMSKSIQKLQAQAIRDELASVKEKP